MKTAGKCPKCGSGRLLFVDQMSQLLDGHPSPLRFRVTGHLDHARTDKLQAFICCRCNYLEWYVSDLADVMKGLGALSPPVRLLDNDLARAIDTLGLKAREGMARGAWDYFAEGVYQEVQLTVGQRSRPRLTDNGTRYVVRIELLANARADLGGYIFRRHNAVGTEPNVPYGNAVRTGDPDLDGAFVLLRTGPVDEIPTHALGPELPVERIPWLDTTARDHLLEAAPEEILLTGNTIGMLLLQYEARAFTHAVNLAVRLAKWLGPSRHAYR